MQLSGNALLGATPAKAINCFERNFKVLGVGTSEILIVLLIALLVLGPKELPKVARTLAKTIRSIQRMTDDIKHTVTAELDELESEEFEPKEKPKSPSIAPPSPTTSSPFAAPKSGEDKNKSEENGDELKTTDQA